MQSNSIDTILKHNNTDFVANPTITHCISATQLVPGVSKIYVHVVYTCNCIMCISMEIKVRDNDFVSHSS